MSGILGLSEQPWNTPFMSSILKELNRLSNKQVKLALTDQFYFIHANEELKKIRLNSDFEILTIESIYLTWQHVTLSEARVSEAETYISEWKARIRPQRSIEVLEKTNQYIFGNEREFFYLPLDENWRPIVLADTIKWCEKIIEDFNPSLVVSLERSSLGINILYEICRSQNISFQTLIYSRIGSRWIIRDDFGYGMSDRIFENVLKTGKNLRLRNAAEQEIHEMLTERHGAYSSFAGDIVKDFQTARSNRFRNLKVDSIKFVKSLYGRYFVRPRIQTIHPIRLEQNYLKLSFWQLRALIFKYLHVFGLRIWGSIECPEERYFAWALHMRPEGSVSVLGRGEDEVEMLLRCANLVPEGVFIAVKENPEMFGYRAADFYRKLRRHKRIKLVDITVPSFELIKNSIGALGISGTFLLESTLLGTPACALGEPEFSKCLSAHGFSEVEEFINGCISGAIQNSRELMVSYVAYVIERSDSDDIAWFSDLNSPRLEATAKRIASQILTT